MTSISSSTAASTRPSLEQLFSKLDINKDSKVSKDEFIAGKPSEVTDSQAAELFNKIDSAGTGAVSLSDFEQGMKQAQPANLLSNIDADTLLSLLEELSQDGTTGTAQASGQSDRFSEMFKKLDSDGDGQLTKAEFVDGRPEEVSEEQAAALFDKLDTEQTGSLSFDDFSTAMAANGPKGPPPGGLPPAMMAEDDEDDTSVSATSSTASSGQTSLEDLIAQLLEQFTSQSTTTAETANGSSAQDFLNALKSYSSTAGYSSYAAQYSSSMISSMI